LRRTRSRHEARTRFACACLPASRGASLHICINVAASAAVGLAARHVACGKGSSVLLSSPHADQEPRRTQRMSMRRQRMAVIEIVKNTKRIGRAPQCGKRALMRAFAGPTSRCPAERR
jgi:hypothetical protein